MGDLEEVVGVEQAELDGATFDERLDLWGTKGGDEVELGGDDVVFEAGLGQHPPVADETDVADREALFQLVDLGGDRRRFAALPLKTSIATGTPAFEVSRP